MSRGTGRSACAASAYMSCSAIYNDYDGVQHDYTRKQGLVWEHVFLPDCAPAEWQDRAVLWNAVEEAEKTKDSRLAREFVVALPVELSPEQWKELLSDFIQGSFVSDGMCADVAIHDPDPPGHNPHAHILLTVRPLNPDGSWQYKTEKEYLCVRNGEERGFTAAEYKEAQAEGWEKQYPYKVGRKKVYLAPSEAEAKGYERASKHPKSTKYGRRNMKQNLRISMTEANQGVLNFSHLLDAPAGKHGFVHVKDGHFVFEDGTRARFLGFNIATRSNTPTHEDAERLAERFASMGVNVIRMHAADAPIGEGVGNWSSCKEAPLLDYEKGTSRFFHPEGLDRFDYFAAKLKEKGIYLHVDLLVARNFPEGDGLDYPGGFPLCTKRYPVYNARLIELQKEYAKAYLCHVNPYTGLAPVDDPAVITVQMTNEESAIKGNPGTEGVEVLKPYRDEVQQRFNEFLLMKYYTRERLQEAWTLDGVCALGEDEDPARGTVRGIEGNFYQPTNEPMGQWDAPDGPARYADFMEFGTWANRRFYQDMKDYLISLGVKVPIAASNLMAGAADVYGHLDGDLMENNSYFNHPLLPVVNDTYMAFGPTEYVSTNPLTMQTGVGAMAHVKKEYDAEGVKLTMRTRDYLADMSGQLALGIMANLVGQLQYFYTDKVGMAVGSVGVVMAIAKILDAFTDVIFGNVIDHSRGGNKKYFRWMIMLAVPAAAIVALLFMIPAGASNGVQVAYALITNLLLTAVIYTMIATPFAAVMVVRTKSNSERSSMGVFRAVGNYGAGMIIAIATIPVTNMLGGTQSAWIKYGVVLALFILLLFAICWLNGHKAAFTKEGEDETGVQVQAEEEPVPFGPAMGMLFKNKYWVIVLLFNTITAITSAVAASSGTYYCKWIFGNDNLVAIIGGAGMLGTIIGFAVSKPIINKFGIKKTVDIGLLGAAIFAGIRCFIPGNIVVYASTAVLASFVQIPLMCLYGVLTAMTVDYNEWKYDKKLVAMSGGAIGFGNKVGSGLGSLLLSLFLILGSYDASLAVASTSMRYSIYGFSNYLPLVINLLMFLLFRGFDLEQKLPQLRKEIEERRAAKQAE